jgi:hypothetical protein
MVLTLGMGMASPESPRSSSMFLIRTERSATTRSNFPSLATAGFGPARGARVCAPLTQHTNGDVDTIAAGKGNLGRHFEGW